MPSLPAFIWRTVREPLLPQVPQNPGRPSADVPSPRRKCDPDIRPECRGRINWTPPRNKIEITSVGMPCGPGVKPNFANCSAKTFSQNVKTAPRNAHAETARPSQVANRNGAVENENTPSIASRSDFLKVYCGVPAARACRSTRCRPAGSRSTRAARADNGCAPAAHSSHQPRAGPAGKNRPSPPGH